MSSIAAPSRNWLSSVSIGRLFTISFLAMLAVMAVFMAVAVGIILRMDASLDTLQTKILPSVRQSGVLETTAARARASTLRIILDRDPAVRDKDINSIPRWDTDIKKAAATYAGNALQPQQTTSLKDFTNAWETYKSKVATIADLSKAGKINDAFDVYDKDASPIASVFNKAVTDMNAVHDALVADMAREVSALERLGYIAGAAALVMMALMAGLIVLVVRGLGRNIGAIVEPIQALATGNTDIRIPSLPERTELGKIAGALQMLRASTAEKNRLEADVSRRDAEAEAKRRADMERLAAMFEKTVGGVVGTVAQAADTLTASSRHLTSSVEDTAGRSNAVAAAAEQASGNVAMVAASAEQLAGSVDEIGRQVERSVAISRTAVAEANATAAIVNELSEAAGKINDILGFISTIAGQTNLLALNATIEAARAGEAGRGFAVVAAEVKELANQTAKAAADISDQIGAMQTSTGRAVDAIGSIAGTIQSMNDYASAIAAAVEEQGSATREIVRNVAQASAGTAEVTTNIGTVAATTRDVGEAADRVQGLAGELSSQAGLLRTEMQRFLTTVRAA